MSQDSSSNTTFKCVLQVLESIDVAWFILENVDLEIGPQSNYDLIMKSLSKCGPTYNVTAYQMLATDFGLPQRRLRLYFVGISNKMYPKFQMQKVTDVLDALKLPIQKPAFWINSDRATHTHTHTHAYRVLEM